MCVARNKKFKNILIFLTRATHIEPFSLEICIWEPFGKWFGDYLGTIWELFGDYVSRRFLRALFFVASPRVLGVGGTPCACRLQERERELSQQSLCCCPVNQNGTCEAQPNS